MNNKVAKELLKSWEATNPNKKPPPNNTVADLCSCGVEVIDILGRNKSNKCSWCGRKKPEQD